MPFAQIAKTSIYSSEAAQQWVGDTRRKYVMRTSCTGTGDFDCMRHPWPAPRSDTNQNSTGLRRMRSRRSRQDAPLREFAN